MAPHEFILSNVTIEDMPEITRLQYDCFTPTPFIRKKFLGCRTEEDIPRWNKEQEKTLREDNHDIWIKVVHKESGRLAAASNWRLYLKKAPMELDDQPPEWLDEEMHARSKAVLDEMNVLRREANPAGFLREWPIFKMADNFFPRETDDDVWLDVEQTCTVALRTQTSRNAEPAA